jgi:hypothetical protein
MPKKIRDDFKVLFMIKDCTTKNTKTNKNNALTYDYIRIK